MENTDKCCKTCTYHDDFSWVCVNGLNEHRADFTQEDFACSCWKSREDKQNDAG